VVGGDEILTLHSKWGKDAGEWLEQKRLLEVSQEETELMQTMLQAMDQEFGYISAADASATGLNQSRTATGIASIERSSNNIVKAVERIHTTGIEAVLEQAVDILLENMDPQRVALTREAELLTLNREEIRDLPRDVRLLLTRSRSSELLTTNQQAAQKANEYFDLVESKPQRAQKLRPMYLAQLKALEVQDADEILPEVSDEDVKAASGAAGAEEGETGRRGEGAMERISIRYEDLLPSEKAQALGKLGIKAGSASEANAGAAAGESNQYSVSSIQSQMAASPSGTTAEQGAPGSGDTRQDAASTTLSPMAAAGGSPASDGGSAGAGPSEISNLQSQIAPASPAPAGGAQ